MFLFGTGCFGSGLFWYRFVLGRCLSGRVLLGRLLLGRFIGWHRFCFGSGVFGAGFFWWSVGGLPYNHVRIDDTMVGKEGCLLPKFRELLSCQLLCRWLRFRWLASFFRWLASFFRWLASFFRCLASSFRWLRLSCWWLWFGRNLLGGCRFLRWTPGSSFDDAAATSSAEAPLPRLGAGTRSPAPVYFLNSSHDLVKSSLLCSSSSLYVRRKVLLFLPIQPPPIAMHWHASITLPVTAAISPHPP